MVIIIEFNFMVTPIQSRHHLKNKQLTQKAKRLSLWETARQDAESITAMIIEKYQPRQIIQWGSVLAPNHFSEASDIDLAIVGLDTIEFMRLLADAEVMTFNITNHRQFKNVKHDIYH